MTTEPARLTTETEPQPTGDAARAEVLRLIQQSMRYNQVAAGLVVLTSVLLLLSVWVRHHGG